MPLAHGLPGDVDAVVSGEDAFFVAPAVALVYREDFGLDVLVAATVDPLARASALLGLVVPLALTLVATHNGQVVQELRFRVQRLRVFYRGFLLVFWIIRVFGQKPTRPVLF